MHDQKCLLEVLGAEALRREGVRSRLLYALFGAVNWGHTPGFATLVEFAALAERHFHLGVEGAELILPVEG